MQHRTTPAALRRTLAALAAALVVSSCAEAPTSNATLSPPGSSRYAMEAPGLCEERAESIYATWQATQNGCDAVPGGFDNELTTWQFHFDDTDFGTIIGSGDLWATFELRVLPDGQVIQRFIRTDAIDQTTWGIEVPPFNVRLVPGVVGSRIASWRIACDSNGSPTFLCGANGRAYQHEELRYCVLNTDDGSATMDSFCAENVVNDPLPTNRSPSVTANASTTGSVSSDGTVSLSSTISDSDGGGPYTYSWSVFNADGSHRETKSGNPGATFTGLPAGSYRAEVTVRDAVGGFGIGTTDFAIQQVAAVSISGITSMPAFSGGQWTAVVNPVEPGYTYRWVQTWPLTSNVQDGPSGTYTGAAGSTSFRLDLYVTRANGTPLGSASINVNVIEDPPTLAISGPSNSRTNRSCTWSTTVYGNAPPYSVAWYRRNSGAAKFTKVATGTTYAGNTGTTSFTLYAEATAPDGGKGRSADFPVNVSASGPICINEPAF